MKVPSFWEVYPKPGEAIQTQALAFGHVAFLAAWREAAFGKSPPLAYRTLEEGVRQGNCHIFFDERGPVGYVAWAFSCPATQRHLGASGRMDLHPSDWNEGQDRYIVDAFFLPGALRRAIRQLRASPGFADCAHFSLGELLQRAPALRAWLNHRPPNLDCQALIRLASLRAAMYGDDRYRAIGYAAYIASRAGATQATPLRFLVTHIVAYVITDRIRFFFNAEGKLVGYGAWADLSSEAMRNLIDGRFVPPLGERTGGLTHRWLTEFVALPGYAKYIARDLARGLLTQCRAFRYLRRRRDTALVKEMDSASFSSRRLLQAPYDRGWRCGMPDCEACR